MDSKNQLRAGLIGCGYQGQWLARAAEALDTFRLTACTDPDESAVKEVLAIAGDAAVEDSAAALNARQDVDVVFVATPHNFLQPYALQAVMAGKVSTWAASHVLVPLSRVNEEDAVRLTDKLLEDPLSTRELSRLYEHYKKSNRVVRDRIIEDPVLFRGPAAVDVRPAVAESPGGCGVNRSPGDLQWRPDSPHSVLWSDIRSPGHSTLAAGRPRPSPCCTTPGT